MNDKLTLLLDTILSHFVAFEENIDKNMFNAVRDQVKKNYYNNFIKPGSFVKELRLFMMQDIFWTANEKHKNISNVTSEMVQTFNKNMYENPLFVQVLVQGNITPDESKLAFESIGKTFNNASNKLNEVPEIVVNKIPENDTKILRVDTFNPKDNNTLITNYYQFGPGSMLNYMHLGK